MKDLESIGYTFEGADATVRLSILHATDTQCQTLLVLDYSGQAFDMNMDSSSTAHYWKIKLEKLFTLCSKCYQE